MRRIILLLALVLLPVAMTGCRGRNNSGPLDLGPEISRHEILLMHNRERSKQGVEQLKHDPVLEERAQKWAEWMANRNSLTHSSPNMRELEFRTWGENIAMGYPSIDEVVHGWMTSPGHRRNILNKNFTHAGFGYARQPDGSPYWCAQFGGK